MVMTRDQFPECLREALNHLYDPDRLRSSPLATLFGVADRYDTPSALRRILTEAVESLEPKADEPPGSRAWRMYDSLLYRYVEQLAQDEVAEQMGLSPRQLRREQRAALEALADLLWVQFDMEGKLLPKAGTEDKPGQAAADAATLSQELAWLKNASLEHPTDLGQTLPPVLDLTRRLADQHRTHLEIALADVLPRLAVHPVALRQILLNLFTAVIPRASGGQVCVSVRPLRWEVELRVRCPAYPSGPKPALENEAASLNMAHQLVALCGGRLALSADARAFDATLTLPAYEQFPVLVIDDNADTLQLLHRYTAGTRYRLIATGDPEQALCLVEKLSPPFIIVLDVMMPQVDGWEVLGRLRQHPRTAHLPIVVCTILSQKDLAFLLGASDFVHKPVTRQAFLSALDRQMERMEPGSR